MLCALTLSPDGMKKALLLLSMVTGVIVALFVLWPRLGSAPTLPPAVPSVQREESGNRPSPATPTGPMSDAEWKKILTPEQFRIIRQDGTELPFSSPLDHETRPGTYVSADCGIPLFRSEQKYDSGTGWPSFWAPISPDVLTLKEDRSLPFDIRTEVRDAKCDGHLGHVFDDGPPPTGKRYCMNGVALKFIPD